MNSKVIELKNENTIIDYEEESILILGEKELIMDSFILCGKAIVNGYTNNRTFLTWNCSKDELAVYANKLRACTDAEILELPLPKRIKKLNPSPKDIDEHITIIQDGQEFIFHSLLLFGRVEGDDKEILLSYESSLNDRIIYANNLKTIIDYEFIKELKKKNRQE